MFPANYVELKESEPVENDVNPAVGVAAAAAAAAVDNDEPGTVTDEDDDEVDHNDSDDINDDKNVDEDDVVGQDNYDDDDKNDDEDDTNDSTTTILSWPSSPWLRCGARVEARYSVHCAVRLRKEKERKGGTLPPCQPTRKRGHAKAARIAPLLSEKAPRGRHDTGADDSSFLV